MTGLRGRRFWAGTLTYAAIVVGTLVLLDVTLIGLGLFPPVSNPGDPDLGWRPSAATGRFEVGRCTEFSTGETITYGRNEDGVRTALSRASINADSTHVRIAVTGDSQTDLCAPNSETHAGVLESELVSDGVPAVVLAYGTGRYSPLQDYLAFRKILLPYHPAVLVVNVYTGNDFQDIMRVDDRPHFVPADTGYTIADPVWYVLDDPRTRLRSRVLFALRSVEDRLGIRRLYLRTKELRQLAAAQGKGLPTVYAYMKDLWKAKERTVGYSDALAAQMLGQQLFFHHLPGSREESLRRVRALMTLIRRENPGLILVMSPLPSYELLQQQPVDEALLRALRRLPITYEEGVRQEGALYESLRTLASEQGWLFVDNLAALKAYHGSERLYNGFDYHLLPVASALIGRAQAAALRDRLPRAGGGPAH